MDEGARAGESDAGGSEPDASLPRTAKRSSSGAMLARGGGGGCATALLGTATTLVAGALVSIDLGAERSQAIGRLAGMLLVPVWALSGLAGVAWAWRPRVGAAVTVAVLALASLPGVLPWVASSRAEEEYRALTDAERAPPVAEVRGARRVLVQRAVGLEMSEPPGLSRVDDPAVAAQLEAMRVPGTRALAWTWETPAGDGLMFVVLAFSAPRGSAEADAAYFEGIVRGATEELGALGLRASDVQSERRGPFDHVVRSVDGAAVELVMRTFLYRHGDALVSASISAVGPRAPELEPVVLSARGGE